MADPPATRRLEAWLDVLACYAVHGVVEWSADGSLLHELGRSRCETENRRGLGELLREARVEAPGAPANAAAPLLVARLDGDDDGLLERAERRLAGGGILLLELAAAGDALQRARALAARLGAGGALRSRCVRPLGEGALLVARRPPARPRIALFSDAPGACQQIRTLGPLEALESRGDLELCLLPHDADAALLADKDLLLLQRFGGLPALRFLLAARELGVPVALELDDDFFNLPWYNPGRKVYGRFEVQATLRALLRGADAVVTSTPYLRERMLEHNPRVHTMHNIVDTTLFTRRATPFDEAGVTTFGYIGTRTHEEDFRPLIEPLKRLLVESDGRVRAVFIGHVPEELARLPHVRYLGWFATYHNAALALARCGANVALAPLLDVEFNRSKSAMKYLEYGACAIPGIFSDVEAYAPFVRHGENGMLVAAHTPAAWEAALRAVVEDPGARRRMAEAAFGDVVESHSIERRADEFLALYRGIIATTGIPRVETPGPAAAPAEPRSGLSVVLRLDDDPRLALPVTAGLMDELPEGSQIIVISGRRELAELLRLSATLAVVSVEDDAPGNGLGRALELARGEWVLHLDGRCKLDADFLQRLTAGLPQNTGAVGPRSMSPGSEQSALAIVELGLGANVHEALARYAAETPLTPVSWLDPHCVLLNRRAVQGVGGIDEAMTWEDALVDLGLRLRRAGFAVLVANAASVELQNRDGAAPAPRARRDSRRRLAERVPRALVPDLDSLIDPARVFGLDGATLDVWIVARPASRYLDACLDRLARFGGVPFAAHVVHERGDARTAALAALHGATAHAVPAIAGVQPLETLLSGCDATHALWLHDGVMVTRGTLREMLDALLLGDRTVVAPYANDGSPEQRMVIDRSLTLETLDELMGERMGARSDRRRPLQACAGFCVMLDLARLREGQPERAPTLLEITGQRGKGAILLAGRAYAHVLAHPEGARNGGFGCWPGGPFDQDLPAFEELVSLAPAGASDLGGFVGRLRPLLAALRQNPGDARILAAVGLLNLLRGDLSEGMSLLERARKLDPYSPGVRDVRRRARELLDLGAPHEAPAGTAAASPRL